MRNGSGAPALVAALWPQDDRMQLRHHRVPGSSPRSARTSARDSPSAPPPSAVHAFAAASAAWSCSLTQADSSAQQPPRHTELSNSRRSSASMPPQNACLLSRQIPRARHTLPVVARVRSITERSLLAHSAAAQAYRGLARQVPLLAVCILEHDVPFHPQRSVGTHRYVNCFVCH